MSAEKPKKPPTSKEKPVKTKTVTHVEHLDHSRGTMHDDVMSRIRGAFWAFLGEKAEDPVQAAKALLHYFEHEGKYSKRYHRNRLQKIESLIKTLSTPERPDSLAEIPVFQLDSKLETTQKLLEEIETVIYDLSFDRDPILKGSRYFPLRKTAQKLHTEYTGWNLSREARQTLDQNQHALETLSDWTTAMQVLSPLLVRFTKQKGEQRKQTLELIQFVFQLYKESLLDDSKPAKVTLDDPL